MRLTAAHRKAGILSIEYHDTIQDAYICKCDPAKLTVDAAYQRPHDEKHSDRMASKKLPVEPYPIASFRDGETRIMEGQHRKWTSIKRGKKVVVVMVKFGLTLPQEAEVYAELNTMKRPNPWNQFQARLTSRTPKFAAIAAIAAEYGYSLKCDDAKGDLRNTHVILEAYDLGFFQQWIELLTAFNDEDGRLYKKVARGALEFQRGLVDFIRAYGKKAVNARVISTLREIGADLIHGQAAKRCNCARANRADYAEVITQFLVMRGAIKSLKIAA